MTRHVHRCTIAKSLGQFRAVLFRDDVPVHHGEWKQSKGDADLDRRRFSGDPWAYAPAFLPAPAPKPRPLSTGAAQLPLIWVAR